MKNVYDFLLGLKKTPLRYISFTDYINTYTHGAWHLAKESSNLNYPSPEYYGDIKPDFGSSLAHKTPDIGVFSLNNGIITSPAGWLIDDKNGLLLGDTTWQGNDLKNKTKIQRRLKIDSHAGKVYSLLSDWAHNVYGHFLLDALPRKHIYDLAGIDVNDADLILCPGKGNTRKQAILRKIGIDINKCLWSYDFTAIRCETAYATSFPGIKRNYAKWIPAYLKSVLLDSQSHNDARRLYVGREGCSRDISNIEDLIPVLNEYNFEIYDPAQSSDPISDFANAAMIIGPHGSGLSDIVFCSKGTRILELIPSDHVHPYYYSLANATGLKYRCIVGTSDTTRPADAWGPSEANFTIDPDILDAAIKNMLKKQSIAKDT